MFSFKSFPNISLTPGKINAVSLATGALAFLCFWLTLSPNAFPGESAALMVSSLRIEPWAGPGQPLWRLAALPLARLNPVTAVYLLNLWSALCGGIVVALLTRYMTRWLQSKIDVGNVDENFAAGVALLSGLFAGLFLATSAPLWIAATRFHPLAFHAILILLAFNLLQDYADNGGRWRAYALALLCGLGAVETVFMLVLAPFFIVRLLFIMYRHQSISWKRIIGLVLTGLLGTVLCAILFRYTQNIDGEVFQKALADGQPLAVYLIRTQVHVLRDMFPRIGWLWPVAFVAVPWVVIQIEAKQGLNHRRLFAADLLHVMLAVVVLLIHTNTTFLPWAAVLPEGRLPVLELLLTSMVAGYVFAIWFVRLRESDLDTKVDKQYGSRKKHKKVAADRGLRLAAAGLLCSILALATLFSAVSNGRLSSGRRYAFAHAYVEELLNQLGDRTWLVTDGMLDPLLKIAALRRGQTLHLIDFAHERHPVRIRRLRQAIATDPSLQEHAATYLNSANLGGAAFLQDWLATDAHAVGKLAFYTPPDLLFGAGLTPLADRLLFIACPDTAALQTRDLLQEQELLWTKIDHLLAGPTEGNSICQLRGDLRRHVSRVANNLGVLLEDLGRPVDAYTAYQRSLSFCPENFSAMLNRVVLTRKGIEAADKGDAEADASKALAKLKRIPDARHLAHIYGYVRVPGEFARRSTKWRLFGQPQMARASLNRAMELTPEDQRLPFLSGLAEIELADGNLAQSEALYQRVLDEMPLDINALLGMVRVALNKSGAKTARVYLEKARTAGLPDAVYLLEDATVDLAAGDLETARRKLQALTDQNPRSLQAWALQANILITQNKADEVRLVILPRMLLATGNAPHYLIALTQGYVLQSKGFEGYEEARLAFMRAYGLSPGNRQVLTALLKLDYALRDAVMTEKHAQALLRIDRDDVLANYLMGTLLIARNDLTGAEEHLRRSLSITPSSPVWNDLAETLRMQGKLDAAEEAVRQALTLDTQNAFAHDTYACILSDQGNLPEAKRACAAARALDPMALPFKLTEVKILVHSGDFVTARDQLRKVSLDRDLLSPQQQIEVDAIAAELTKNR